MGRSMVEHDGRRPSLSFWIVIVAGLLALPAVLNGFPFVFADSADYLVFTPQLHRSPFYSPLIFAVHLNAWPFGIVLLQTLIVAHLLFLLVRVSLGGRWVGAYLGLGGLLAALTALPWVAGQIMPDVFTPVMMLSIYLVGFHLPKLCRLERGYLVLLLAGAVSVHVSHIPAALGLVLLSGVLLLARRRSLAEVAGRLVLVGAPVGAAAAAFFAYFSVIHGVPALSPSGPVFFMANLIEHGPARSYLEDACPEAGLRICALVDRLPATANEFLWFTGQLQELGGFSGMREEAAAVVGETIRTRPLEVASLALGNGARQLVTFGLSGAYGPFLRPHMTELMALKFGPDGQGAAISPPWIGVMH
jgi:hypothetical protein